MIYYPVECFQRSSVGRHCVVGEEASDDLLDPSPLLGDWLMHPPSQLLLSRLLSHITPIQMKLPTFSKFGLLSAFSLSYDEVLNVT
jgi:hypothetical protein